MAVVEEPREVIVEREREPRRSGVGTIVAIVLGVLILLALLIYGLPYLTGGGNSSTNGDSQMPATDTSTSTSTR